MKGSAVVWLFVVPLTISVFVLASRIGAIEHRRDIGPESLAEFDCDDE